MLVLSIKPGEHVVIGDGITVKVVKICGNNVKVGFTAPAELGIDRQKVHDAKHTLDDVELDKMVERVQSSPQPMDPADQITPPEFPVAAIEKLQAEVTRLLEANRMLRQENSRLRAKREDTEHVG